MENANLDIEALNKATLLLDEYYGKIVTELWFVDCFEFLSKFIGSMDRYKMTLPENGQIFAYIGILIREWYRWYREEKPYPFCAIPGVWAIYNDGHFENVGLLPDDNG